MKVGWSYLILRRTWYTFIYKAISRQLPSYLYYCINLKEKSSYQLRSQNCILLTAFKTRTELGKKAFQVSARLAGNELLRSLKLHELALLRVFKTSVKLIEENERVC